MKRSRVKVKAVVILFLVLFVEAVENDADSVKDTTEANLSFKSEPIDSGAGKLLKKLKLYTFKSDENAVEKPNESQLDMDAVGAVKSSASLMNQFIGNKNYVIMPVQTDQIPVQVIVDREPKIVVRPNSRIVKIRKLPRNETKETNSSKETTGSTEAVSDVTEAYVSDDENANKSKRVRPSEKNTSSTRGKLKYTDSQENESRESDNYPDIEKFRKRVEEVMGRRFQSHRVPEVPVRDDGIIPPVVRQLLAQIVMNKNLEKVTEKIGNLEFNVTETKDDEDTKNGLVGAHSDASVLAGKSGGNLNSISQKNSNVDERKANATYARNNPKNFRQKPKAIAVTDAQIDNKQAGDEERKNETDENSGARNLSPKLKNNRNNLFRKNKEEPSGESGKEDLNDDNKTAIRSDANENETSTPRTPIKINNEDRANNQRKTGFKNNEDRRTNAQNDPARTIVRNNLRQSTQNSAEEKSNEATERSSSRGTPFRGIKKFVPTKYETFSSFISDSQSRDVYRNGYNGDDASGRYNPELDLDRGNLRYSADKSSENGNYRGEPNQGQYRGDYNNQSFRPNRTRLNAGGRIPNVKNDANKQPVVDQKSSDDLNKSNVEGNRKYPNKIRTNNQGVRVPDDASQRNANKQPPPLAGGQENHRGTGLVNSNSKYDAKDENESDVRHTSTKNAEDDNKDILISTVKPSDLNTNQPNYKGVIGLRKHHGETAVGRDDQSNNNKFSGSKISFGSSVGANGGSISDQAPQNGDARGKNQGDNLRINLGGNQRQETDNEAGRNVQDPSQRNNVIDRNLGNTGRQNTARPPFANNGNAPTLGFNNDNRNGRPGSSDSFGAGRQGAAGDGVGVPNLGESGNTGLSQDDGRDLSRGQEGNANKFNSGRYNGGEAGKPGAIGRNPSGQRNQEPSPYRLNLGTSFGVGKNSEEVPIVTETSKPSTIVTNQGAQQGGLRNQNNQNKYYQGTSSGSGRYDGGSSRSTEKPLSSVLDANSNLNQQPIDADSKKPANNFNYESPTTRAPNNVHFNSNNRDYSTNGNRNTNTNLQYNQPNVQVTPSTPPPPPSPLQNDYINNYYNNKINSSLPFVQTSQFSFSEVTNFVPEYDDRPLNSTDADTNKTTNSDNAANSGINYNNGQNSGNQNAGNPQTGIPSVNNNGRNNGNASPSRSGSPQKNVFPSTNSGQTNIGLNNDKPNVQSNFGTQYTTERNNEIPKPNDSNFFSSPNGNKNLNNGSPPSFRPGELAQKNSVPPTSTNQFNPAVNYNKPKSQFNQANTRPSFDQSNTLLDSNRGNGVTLSPTSQVGPNQNNDLTSLGGRKANDGNKGDVGVPSVDTKTSSQNTVKPTTNDNSNFFAFLNGNRNKNEKNVGNSPKPEGSTPKTDLLTSSTEKIDTKVTYTPNFQKPVKVSTVATNDKNGKSNNTAKKYPYELDNDLVDFVYNTSFLSVNGGSSRGIDPDADFSKILGKNAVVSPPDITQKRVSTAFDDKEKTKEDDAKKLTANGNSKSSLNGGDSKNNTGNSSSPGQAQSSIKNGIQLTGTQDRRAGINRQGASAPNNGNAIISNGASLNGNNQRVSGNVESSTPTKKPVSEGPSSQFSPQSNLSANKNPITTGRLDNESNNQNKGTNVKIDASGTQSSNQEEPESSKEDFRVGSDSQNYNLGVRSEPNSVDEPVSKLSQENSPRQTVDVTSNLNNNDDKLDILGNGRPFQQNKIAAKQNSDYARDNDKLKINLKKSDDANNDENKLGDYVNYSTPKPDLNEKDSRKNPELLSTSENTHGAIGQQYANSNQFNRPSDGGKFSLQNRKRPQSSDSEDKYDLKSEVQVGGQRYEQNFEARGPKRLPSGTYERQDPSSGERGSIKYKFDPLIYDDISGAHFPSEFGYQFDTPNGISTYQRATLKRLDDHMIYVVKGSYQYTAPDGTLVNVVYTADENGYHPQIISPDLSKTNYAAPNSQVNEEQQLIDDNFTPIANDE